MATLLLVLIYVAFISLGLPDALLGAGWPSIQSEFGVPYSFAGLASMLGAGGTILSSLVSGRVLKRFGTGAVTAVSVGMTAVALLGIGWAPSFWWILGFAVPLGLGAGAVDAGLNAYVAAHYESRHMSWLHSFWGVGALSGPLVLSGFLSQGFPWRGAYLVIASFQVVLVTVLVLALPLWTRVKERHTPEVSDSAVGVPTRPWRVRGVKSALAVFFLYCGIEASMGLWGGSFLFQTKGLDAATAAAWVSWFYAAITLGRFLTGFLTYRLSNDVLIRSGGLVVLLGAGLMLTPLPLPFSLAGFVLVGLGCAPIFPCMLHETPVRFGSTLAPTIMGFQMAGAYVGSTFLPPLFGFVAGTSLGWLPWFVMGYGLLMLLIFGGLRRSTKPAEAGPWPTSPASKSP